MLVRALQELEFKPLQSCQIKDLAAAAAVHANARPSEPSGLIVDARSMLGVGGTVRGGNLTRGTVFVPP